MENPRQQAESEKKIHLPYCCCRGKHFCQHTKVSHKRFCAGKYLECDPQQKWNWGREFLTKLFCCLFAGSCHINNFEINSIVQEYKVSALGCL